MIRNTHRKPTGDIVVIPQLPAPSFLTLLHKIQPLPLLYRMILDLTQTYHGKVLGVTPMHILTDYLEGRGWLDRWKSREMAQMMVDPKYSRMRIT